MNVKHEFLCEYTYQMYIENNARKFLESLEDGNATDEEDREKMLDLVNVCCSYRDFIVEKNNDF